MQLSDETIYAETHHYTAISGHFKAPADLHRKKEPMLRTEEEVGGSQSWSESFGQKKSLSSTEMLSSFPQSSGPLRSHWNDGDIGVHIIAYARETEPASAWVRSYGYAFRNVCKNSNEPQRCVRPGTLLI